jgi:hypothetical protein
MQTRDITGHTLRFNVQDGPMVGKSFDHELQRDGKVRWPCTSSPEHGDDSYQVEPIGDKVVAVSYLDAHRLVSFASNAQQLVAQHGTFDEV